MPAYASITPELHTFLKDNLYIFSSRERLPAKFELMWKVSEQVIEYLVLDKATWSQYLNPDEAHPSIHVT